MPRPRIRTFKPEHPLHPKIGPLSDRAYRVWATMICYADDEGRREFRLDELRVLIYGYQPHVTVKQLKSCVDELKSAHLIHLYEHNGKTIYQMHDWKDHQKVQHPTPSMFPGPPSGTLMNAHENSGGLKNPHPDRIGIGSGPGSDQDRTGSDGKGEGRETPAPASAPVGRAVAGIPESELRSLERKRDEIAGRRKS